MGYHKPVAAAAFVPKDLYWCFLAAASVVAINVARISLMGLSQTHYEAVHNQWGNAIANLLIVGLTVGFCLLGVRREKALKHNNPLTRDGAY